MAAQRVRVLVGCVTYDRKAYCLAPFLERLAAVAKGADVLFIDNSEGSGYARRLESEGFAVMRTAAHGPAVPRLARAYRALRRAFLRGGWDFLLSLEQDVLPPWDVVPRLVARRRPVVGAWYRIGDEPDRVPCVLVGARARVSEHPHRPFVAASGAFVGPGEPAHAAAGGTRHFVYRVIEEAALRGCGVRRVFAVGLGCVLIHRSVLECVRFRWQPGAGDVPPAHSDMAFYDDCRRRRIPVYVDPSLPCRHLDRART